jgi:hypothetical protein
MKIRQLLGALALLAATAHASAATILKIDGSAAGIMDANSYDVFYEDLTGQAYELSLQAEIHDDWPVQVTNEGTHARGFGTTSFRFKVGDDVYTGTGKVTDIWVFRGTTDMVHIGMTFDGCAIGLCRRLLEIGLGVRGAPGLLDTNPLASRDLTGSGALTGEIGMNTYNPDSGHINAFGVGAQAFRLQVLSAVPEPGMLPMLGGGLLLLAAAGRRAARRRG